MFCTLLSLSLPLSEHPSASGRDLFLVPWGEYSRGVIDCATYIGELPAQPWPPLSPLPAVSVFPGSVMSPTKGKLISQMASRHPTSFVTDHGGGKQDDEIAYHIAALKLALQLEAATSLPVSVFPYSQHLCNNKSMMVFKVLQNLNASPEGPINYTSLLFTLSEDRTLVVHSVRTVAASLLGNWKAPPSPPTEYGLFILMLHTQRLMIYIARQSI